MASRDTQAELDTIALAKKISEDKLKEQAALEVAAEEPDAQDESDDGLMEDESILGVKKDGLPDYDEDAVTIEGDLNLDFQLLRQIPCPYTNVIAEFADVEIFAISVDSFLLELTAHHYHNWLLGGQTIVLAKQIDHFLNALEELSAKFVLVWFSDLVPFFEQDAYLSFLHSFTIAYLSSHPKWSRSLECFANPLDELWNDYLHRLTPSFMLMSLENPSRAFVNEDIDFSSRFISIAIHLITSAIPVVFFNGFTINFSNVMAYRLSTVPLSITNLKAKIAKNWEENYDMPKKIACADVEKTSLLPISGPPSSGRRFRGTGKVTRTLSASALPL